MPMMFLCVHIANATKVIKCHPIPMKQKNLKICQICWSVLSPRGLTWVVLQKLCCLLNETNLDSLSFQALKELQTSIHEEYTRWLWIICNMINIIHNMMSFLPSVKCRNSLRRIKNMPQLFPVLTGNVMLSVYM